MPKIAVVFFGTESNAPMVAEHAARGARSVRFSEVDVHPGTHASADSLRAYDGIVLAALPGADTSGFLGDMAAGDFTNTVLGTVGDPALAGRVASLGGIIASVRSTNNQEADATTVGERVAKVAGWVRHALGHEHGHHHSH